MFGRKKRDQGTPQPSPEVLQTPAPIDQNTRFAGGSGLTLHNPTSIAPPVAWYSQGVEIPPGARTLHIAGVVGITPDGTLEIGFEAQHRRIWMNVVEILKSANMGVEDLVRLNVFALDAANVHLVNSGRQEFLNGHKPVSTFVAIQALARQEFLVEMDAIAAKVD